GIGLGLWPPFTQPGARFRFSKGKSMTEYIEGLPGDEPMHDQNTEPDAGIAFVTSGIVASIIRTVVPYLVGWIVTLLVMLLTPIGVALPPEFAPWLTNTLTVALGTGYYILARWLEKKFPRLPVLGARPQPVSPPPQIVPVAAVVEID